MSGDSEDFGQNQWLVDEMYQKFQQDPASVTPSWKAFFSTYHPQGSSDGVSASKAGDPTATQKTSASATTAQTIAGQTTAPAAELRTGGSAKIATTQAADRQTTADVLVSQKTPPSTQTHPAPATPTQPRATVPARDAHRKPSTDSSTAIYPASDEEKHEVIRGAANALVKNMNASLTLPTATTVRAIPAKLMMDNRITINSYLQRKRGGKISFTHLLGYAMIQAVKAYPNMNNHFQVIDGKPTKVIPPHINLGLAVDIKGKAGARTLVVAAIKNTETMSFSEFVSAYEDIVRRARNGKLTAADFGGVTISLTNPGGIGTNHSVPRLTVGQGTILGAGALMYPAQYEGTAEDTLANLAVGKIMTLTSTYDHRIIQGAESGEWLKTIHQLLISDQFYDDVFASLTVPYEPVRWARDITDGAVNKDARVLEFISAFRNRGHLMADTNPLRFVEPGKNPVPHPDLLFNTHGLTLWDLDREFAVGGFAGHERMKLRQVLTTLRDAYSRKVGIEYTHILDNTQREWVRNRVEAGMPKPTIAQQKFILTNLNAAEAFENFLHTKYVGQKRFSLEGSESLIPMMEAAIDTAAEHQLDEVVIGMPHRGRLNVLANIVGKPYRQIFTEFEGNMDPDSAHGSGDVKYHLGAEGTHIQMFGENDIKVTLTANPSHLETVDPVLEGIVRAKQDLLNKGDSPDGYSVMALMLHGDAAFAGQGVVAETLQLSTLRGYRTGGTVHIVVNNQIGFTTAPSSGRSSQYATDVAKMVGSPIFHVNGDDPEACVWVAQLAVDFRQRFHKDVVIDLVSYRRRGHNEAGNPSMTQPAMYKIIDKKPGVRRTYTLDLIGRGDITEEEAEAALRDYQGQLETVFNQVREIEKHPQLPSIPVDQAQKVPTRLVTAVTPERLKEIADAFASPPEGFHVHKRVAQVSKHRLRMLEEGNVDWAFGELLAFGTLVQEGRIVRIAGQDTQRGTFTQRHAVAVDEMTSEVYSPLHDVALKHGGKFMIYNSALTEYAGLGFEYGYSVGDEDALVCWEAQFGDFANGAQSVIDEYISSGEAKWGQTSGVVLLLPHGHEGMGPDHSSARIERFLQLCAESSMTLAQPSTPANYFHLLRRHARNGIKRPLVVFTPKSMLRNKLATSSIPEFTDMKFMSVINDPTLTGSKATRNPSEVETVLLCSGKLYYELEKRRAKDDRDDIAIIRLEQFYPIPHNRLHDAFAIYPNVKEVRWVQDEPANQGAWSFLALMLPDVVDNLPPLKRVSRRAMSATATGISKVHQIEEAQLLDEAFE